MGVGGGLEGCGMEEEEFLGEELGGELVELLAAAPVATGEE